jgi:hypothetical protein
MLANLGFAGEEAEETKIVMASRALGSNATTLFQPIMGAVASAEDAQAVAAENVQHLDGEYILLLQER